MKKYNTTQRKLLLDFLKRNSDRQFSIEAIVAELCDTENISSSSIYRNINDMIEEGSVARFPAQGTRQFLYQYVGDEHCKNHIHLKCEACGELFHLDELAMSQIVGSIESSKAFTIDIQKTILYGTCEKCN
ncbi:MAG: Fur family transcriptional regulator [Raoultibacter sp.]